MHILAILDDYYCAHVGPPHLNDARDPVARGRRLLGRAGRELVLLVLLVLLGRNGAALGELHLEAVAAKELQEALAPERQRLQAEFGLDGREALRLLQQRGLVRVGDKLWKGSIRTERDIPGGEQDKTRRKIRCGLTAEDQMETCLACDAHCLPYSTSPK